MSGSVGLRNFKLMLNTVASIADNFYIGPYNTQIGVDVFSTSVKTAIKLKDYNNRYYLERAIKKIKYKGGWTNTHHGLNHVQYNSFSYRYGHRYNVPRIAIVLTDGQSQHKSRTLKAARNLKNAGVKIFSVGIGSGIDWSEVRGISSTGRKRASPNWALKVNNFVELSKSSTSLLITETACSVGSVIKPHARFNGLRIN
ncbi:collagen alpha-1(XII) chain-like isoform X2 [Mytilus trossulus]